MSDHDLVRDVEQFLYKEARLLDGRKFREWLALMTDDVRYWMPTRYNRKRDGPGEQWEVEKELDELGWLDETKASLTMRVERFYSGLAWAEEPPSRTRHLITNVEVLDGESDDALQVFSNFMTYRSRLEGLAADTDFFVGQRQDILRRTPDGFMIASRKIVSDFVVLNAQNLSIFF
jgi:3-phenylpropionate/cinnamic acid dioxygenase small subunit